MAQNPDVTVRSRGVMEKCTFCLQRIVRAKSKVVLENRELIDGELQTACQQSCPTNAIDVEANPPEIQKEGCISCWYCEKVCPEGAIEADWSMMERASRSNLIGYIEALKEAESQGKFRPYIDYQNIK